MLQECRGCLLPQRHLNVIVKYYILSRGAKIDNGCSRFKNLEILGIVLPSQLGCIVDTIYEKNVFVKVGPRIGVVDTPFTEEVMPRFQAKNMTKLKV